MALWAKFGNRNPVSTISDNAFNAADKRSLSIRCEGLELLQLKTEVLESRFAASDVCWAIFVLLVY